MDIELNGDEIRSEKDFHRAFFAAIDSQSHGENLDALWDTLSTDIERPVHLTWRNARSSEEAMPERFAAIVALLREVEEQDRSLGYKEPFVLKLS